MSRIAVVDDEDEFRDELVFQLRHHGYDAIGLPDGPSLYRYLAAEPCSIVLLDLGLPGEDGHSICRHLSHRDDLGVIMLTARGGVDDRIEGLAGGADAYLTKPADPRELVATIESVRRRLRGAVAHGQPAEAVPSGEWVLYPRQWRLVAPNGTAVSLTAYESTLLTLLVARAGEPVPRRDIITAFGHDYRHYDQRRLEAIVSRLRRKLEPMHDGQTPLQAAHGIGYAFIDSARAA